MKATKYYKKLDDHKVQCQLCPHECVILPDKSGICLTRKNESGVLYSANYNRAVSLSMDPMEKKPLYHFYPGGIIFSTGPSGCNFKCEFCQNHEISQKETSGHEITAEELVMAAAMNNSVGIAYTYTEPFIWYEFLLESTRKAHENGLQNVLITNGFVNEDPLKELLPYIDAMNIDIKSMNPDFYTKRCKGRLEPVLRTCETVKKCCHVEITNLLVTGQNDSDEDIQKLVNYVKENIGVDTPVHFSRYFPHYRMHEPPTPPERLETALEIGRESLRYVYAGNISIKDGNDTVCDKCGNLLIQRTGYETAVKGLNGKQCAKCGTEHNFVGL